jgi:hypothetical protein
MDVNVQNLSARSSIANALLQEFLAQINVYKKFTNDLG